ncbi:hypothetical protein EDD22DRAFT_842617 [Suillus occidentalis]|nr:hypothetical protein EDD22DRAFT_842617 [Suillus occidentalis]
MSSENNANRPCQNELGAVALGPSEAGKDVHGLAQQGLGWRHGMERDEGLRVSCAQNARSLDVDNTWGLTLFEFKEIARKSVMGEPLNWFRGLEKLGQQVSAGDGGVDLFTNYRSEPAAREPLNWCRGMGKLGQQVRALVEVCTSRPVLRRFAVMDLECPWSLLDVHNGGLFERGLATTVVKSEAGCAAANQLSGTVATGQPNDCIASPAHDYICYFLESSWLELHVYAIKIPGNDDQQADSDAWDGRIWHGVCKDAEKNSWLPPLIVSLAKTSQWTSSSKRIAPDRL